MVNKELLNKVMDHILANQEQWKQNSWATKTECGTTYCFAGWAVVLSGYKPSFMLDYNETNYCIKNGISVPIELVAIEELGISSEESTQLFNGSSTLEELKDIVNELTSEEI